MIERVIWIILDSVGMGELPDAKEYGDEGSNTLGNISKVVGGLRLPNMESLGLGNIEGMEGIIPVESPKGAYGRLGVVSKGKDTTIGHWEMVGIYSPIAFPTYPNGFGHGIIDEFERRIGRKIIGNKAASGTEIIKELGEEHLKTGSPIVYTSADSVFQIAAHEEVIPIGEQYRICRIARELLVGKNAVARVIARPFKGEVGNFQRTENRKDFSLAPPEDTILDRLQAKNLDVIGVGKIEDIFAGKGITHAVHTKDNMDGVDKTIEFIKKSNRGLIFTNLVEFDSKWGHRNDYIGYAEGLKDFDARLPEIIEAMGDRDILIINADHGCDPTTPSTDHSREYSPLLVYGKSLKADINLKTRKSLGDIGQTIAQIFDTPPLGFGEGFLGNIQ